MMKIAICIRGSLRTWDVCKHTIFKMYDFSKCSVVPEVDWFFDIWDNDSFTYYELDENLETIKAERVVSLLDADDLEQKIRNDFAMANAHLTNFNLHKFDPDLNPAESFLKLVNLANLSKRMYELSGNFKYDVVLQIRPDVCTYYENDDAKMDYVRESIIESRHHYILNYEKNLEEKVPVFNDVQLNDRYDTWVSDVPGIPDTIFYGKSQIIDLLSNAYLYLKNKDEPFIFPHASLYLFLQKYGVIMNSFTPEWKIVRNMKIAGKYDYQKYVDNPELVTDPQSDFSNSLRSCSSIWYDLFDRHKII